MSSGEGKTDENGQGRTKTDGDGKQFSVSPVWTGSAADYDKPSLHYVGTGEGAQVYGWGLYGASAEGRNASDDPEYIDLSVLIQRLKDFHGLPRPRNAGQRQRTRRRPVRVVER